MLLNVLERHGHASSFWNELDKLQEDLAGNFFTVGGFTRNYYNPPVNIYTNKDNILLIALVPGYESENIEISIVENKVQIKGLSKQTENLVGSEIQRQEIVNKDFQRTIELPFRIDSDQTEATCKNGILHVKLTKAEVDKPKKITVHFEN